MASWSPERVTDAGLFTAATRDASGVLVEQRLQGRDAIADREHAAAAAGALLEKTAVERHAHRCFEIERPGCVRRGDFAGAVADDGGRPDAPRCPQREQPA